MFTIIQSLNGKSQGLQAGTGIASVTLYGSSVMLGIAYRKILLDLKAGSNVGHSEPDNINIQAILLTQVPQ